MKRTKIKYTNHLPFLNCSNLSRVRKKGNCSRRARVAFARTHTHLNGKGSDAHRCESKLLLN